MTSNSNFISSVMELHNQNQLIFKIYLFEFWIHIIIFMLRPCTNQQILQKIEAHILLLNWAVSCGGGVGQVDRCSKTLYCACVLYVTLPSQRARAIIPQTAIFDEFSTLLFSAVTKPTPVIFSQVSLKLKRILHDKNYQNGSSGFGEICIVLFLWRDR